MGGESWRGKSFFILYENGEVVFAKQGGEPGRGNWTGKLDGETEWGSWVGKEGEELGGETR